MPFEAKVNPQSLLDNLRDLYGSKITAAFQLTPPPRVPQEDIECIESEKARRYISSLPFKPPIPPERIYPNANPDAINLLQKMLVYAHFLARAFAWL